MDVPHYQRQRQQIRNPRPIRSKYDQVILQRQQNNNSSLAAVGGSMLHIQSEKVMKKDPSDYNIQLTTPQQVRQVPARDYLRRKPAMKYNIGAGARTKNTGNHIAASPYRPTKDFLTRNAAHSNSELSRNGSQVASISGQGSIPRSYGYGGGSRLESNVKQPMYVPSSLQIEQALL